MTKRHLIPILALCLVANLQGCSSGGSKDETEVAEANDKTFAEEGEGDFADDSGSKAAPGDEAKNEASDLGGGDQAAAPTEEPADDLALGDEPPKDQAAPTDQAANAAPAPGDDLSLDEGAAAGSEASTEQPPADQAANPEAAPTDQPVFNEEPKNIDQQEIASNEPPPEEPPAAPVAEEPKSPASFAPLQKVKDAPFAAKDGTNLNRVYIARPKETVKKIAGKIYGDEKRSKDLVKWNPILKRGTKPGDKIYYSSPTNAADTKMMTWYEEQNIAPQMYTSVDGDNIRKVASKLLGFKDAWKEVWETNPAVESKGDIPAGTGLRYWTETAGAPAAALAQNGAAPNETGLPDEAPGAGAPPPPDAGMAPPPPPDMPPNGMPPQPGQPGAQPPPGQPGAQANNGFPPPPPGQPGANDPMAPPPPQPGDMPPGSTPPPAAGAVGGPNDPMAPPPPPPAAKPELPKPPKKVAAAPPVDQADGGMDADTTMIIGLGGILLIAAAILFVVIRKNRAKRMDLGQTQI